jgi:hypothetical protein
MAAPGPRHLVRTCCYFFDVSFAETLRRHATRPQATHFAADEMRAWYVERDLLSGSIEIVIPETRAQGATIEQLLADLALPTIDPS